MEHIKLAGIPIRILSSILDWAIVWGLLTGMAFTAHLLLPLKISNDFGMFLMVLGVFYMFIKDGFRGQSIGKKIVNIRVVSDETKRPIDHPYSIIRFFSFIVLGPIDWICVIGKKRQRLGDIFAKTSVIRVY